MTKTNPKNTKKIITGYIGVSVGANDLFKFRNAKKGEYFEGEILDKVFSIAKEKIKL